MTRTTSPETCAQTRFAKEIRTGDGRRPASPDVIVIVVPGSPMSAPRGTRAAVERE
ncbi:hypothetical protein [Nocardia tengchongensis]|uniref:hypothetical protein n=1 Tax=Nocardia tengchongensis TaxID=2055889 RepID=UPI00361510F6